MSVIIEDYLNYLEFKYLYEKTIYEIQLLTEADEKTQVRTFQKMVEYSKKGLSRYNINTSFINRFSNKIKKTIEVSYKNGVSSEKAANGLITDFMKEIKSIVGNMSLPKKIMLGVIVFIIVVLLNTLFMQMGVTLLAKYGLSLDTTIALMVPIAGPLFEEAAKNFFIQIKMPWVGTGVVFGMEAMMYLYRFWKMGKLSLQNVISRVIALGFHFLTTLLQKKYIDKHPDKVFTAYLIGFMCHFVWNCVPAAAILFGGVGIEDMGL